MSFKIKLQELVEKIEDRLHNTGTRLIDVVVKNHSEHVNIVQFLIQDGMSFVPKGEVFTILYNPVTGKYMWHSGFPSHITEKQL
ncbi:MAG: hypothetical protein [Caudoviricetes sp.]|nr:MAG: hypothetical protein [Caudoviricetes sp.]